MLRREHVVFRVSLVIDDPLTFPVRRGDYGVARMDAITGAYHQGWLDSRPLAAQYNGHNGNTKDTIYYDAKYYYQSEDMKAALPEMFQRIGQSKFFSMGTISSGISRQCLEITSYILTTASYSFAFCRTGLFALEAEDLAPEIEDILLADRAAAESYELALDAEENITHNLFTDGSWLVDADSPAPSRSAEQAHG